MIYQKDDSLYLLSEDSKKILEVIYLKSYVGTKVNGNKLYPFGLELINVGTDNFKKYYFYTNNEDEINTWIKYINDCSEFDKFEIEYEVLEEIGKGKFSIVSRCIERSTSIEYAVKKIEKGKLNLKELDLLQNEISIIPGLYHKSVARYINIMESKTDMYIIMEKVEGGELHEYLQKRNRLSELEAVYITYQILTGIEYIHKIGIIHRDLKPDNILIEFNSDEESIFGIKLIDFGLSVIAEPGAIISDPCGTPAYVAPEILMRKTYDSQVDMWSLGVITYLMYFLI